MDCSERTGLDASLQRGSKGAESVNAEIPDELFAQVEVVEGRPLSWYLARARQVIVAMILCVGVGAFLGVVLGSLWVALAIVAVAGSLYAYFSLILGPRMVDVSKRESAAGYTTSPTAIAGLPEVNFETRRIVRRVGKKALDDGERVDREEARRLGP